MLIKKFTRTHPYMDIEVIEEIRNSMRAQLDALDTFISAQYIHIIDRDSEEGEFLVNNQTLNAVLSGEK